MRIRKESGKGILIFLFSCMLFLPTQATADRFVVADIRVNGLQRVSAGTLFSVLPVSVGDNVGDQQLASAARVLFRTGYFDDIKLARDGDVLVISLVERPSISEITFEGNKAIKTEDLKKGLAEMGLEEGQVFQRATLERITVELKRQYVSRGRYSVQVNADVVSQPRNRVSIHMKIEEGPVASIRHLNIVGNKVFSDEDLLDLFEMKEPSWLSFYTKDDQYSREKFAGDLERLRSWYLDRGYINFNIESTQVSISPDKRHVYVVVNVSEGEQFKIRDVKLAGDLVVSEPELRLLMLMREGQTFSRQVMTLTSELLTKRLGNEGYTFANVNGMPEVHEDDKSVTVTYFVDPGKRSYVRRVNFRGNTRTADEVLRREMVQMEGGWASTSKIEMSKTRIERLGFFRGVNVETRPVPGTTDQVDVEYAVEEQPSGSLSASLGFAQGTGLILGASVSQNNFLGSGNKVSFSINNSRFQTNYSFSYLNPYYTLDGVSRGFNFYFRETDFDVGNIQAFTTDAFGGGVTYGYPINNSDRLTFRLNYSNTTVNQGLLSPLEISRFLEDEGTKFDSFSVIGGWSRNRLDRGVFATAGSKQNLNLEVSTPPSDLQFYKLTYRGEKYFPLSRKFNLKLRTDLGYGDAFGSSKVMPFFEHFYAGGFNSVRGYEANTLGPRNTPVTTAEPDPYGGNVLIEGSAEFIFPTPFIKDQRSVRSSLFVDAGNVFVTDRAFGIPTDQDESIRFKNLRYSAGLGVTWLTGMGPLTFSLGYPLNEKKGDETQIFQFAFGQAF